ncbi:MAG: DUF489 family protein [Pseudomonadota bacterium]|nr:DUF489 family protein [Pseudomonadota bacterium]HJO35937.1 DUF489 family protein [Gammaproteobacteria bacterium]
MSHSIVERTVALSALCQSGVLVHQVARSGQAPADPVDALLFSLLKIEAPSVAAIYGDISRLRPGLDALHAIVSRAASARDAMPAAYYAFSVRQLERRVFADKHAPSGLRRDIGDLVRAHEQQDLSREALIERAARIYQRLTGHMRMRIVVRGRAEYLQRPENADLVRALLLAGLRASHLWRQCGGRVWTLPLQRRRLVQTANDLRAGRI